jgi:phosphoglucomutase
MLICEMASYYKSVGKSLLEVLADLYKEHGIFCCSQNSFTFEGAAGMEIMKNIMASLRANPPKEINGHPVTAVLDYGTSVETDTATGKQTPITLPKSDVLYYRMGNDGDNVIVRPSGTEPKIKIYITATSNTAEKAKEKSDGWLKELSAQFK